MRRSTRQREAIKDAFKDAQRPLSAQEALDAALEDAGTLSLATVYRALRDLVDSGWLVTVELPGQPPRYERGNLGHHHHFWCQACDRLYDIEGCPGNLSSLVPPGFQMDDHGLILYGRCRTCTDAA